MKSDPTIGIIIPTKNEAHNLPTLLASLARNGASSDSIVVIDNYSVDATVAIAKEFGAAVKHGGPNQSAQRNQGAAAIDSSHLMFLDADMELEDGILSEIDGLLRAGHGCIVIPERSIASNYWGRVRAFERSFYDGDPTIEAARVFSRELFELSGGYDASMVGGEDWLLSNKIRQLTQATRTVARILHHEPSMGIFKIAEKYLYYGRGYYKLFRFDRALFAKHANPLRVGHINQSHRLLNPNIVFGLIVYRLVTHIAGAIGFFFRDGQRLGCD